MRLQGVPNNDDQNVKKYDATQTSNEKKEVGEKLLKSKSIFDKDGDGKIVANEITIGEDKTLDTVIKEIEDSIEEKCGDGNAARFRNAVGHFLKSLSNVNIVVNNNNANLDAAKTEVESIQKEVTAMQKIVNEYNENKDTAQKDFFDSLSKKVDKSSYSASSALKEATKQYDISQTRDKLSSIEGQKNQEKNREKVSKEADNTIAKVFDVGYEKLVQNGLSKKEETLYEALLEYKNLATKNPTDINEMTTALEKVNKAKEELNKLVTSFSPDKSNWELVDLEVNYIDADSKDNKRVSKEDYDEAAGEETGANSGIRAEYDTKEFVLTYKVTTGYDSEGEPIVETKKQTITKELTKNDFRPGAIGVDSQFQITIGENNRTDGFKGRTTRTLK